MSAPDSRSGTASRDEKRSGRQLRVPAWGLLALVIATHSTIAHAEAQSLASHVSPQDTRSDGDYGRMADSWTLALAADAELGPGGPRPNLRFSAHHAWMTGGYMSFAAPPSFDGSAWLVAAGIDLRPLFVPRWSQDMERGPDWFDLWLDSISLGLGAYWQRSPETVPHALGFESSLGCAFPLSARAHGLWFDTRAVVRIPDAPKAADWAAQLGLSWHWGYD